MTKRENILRAIRFEEPDYIPMAFHINPACWHHYDQQALQDQMEAHTFLFPDFQRQATIIPNYGLTERKDQPYTDPWGCVWQTTDDGITGAVHQHPLENWDKFKGYVPPDPEQTDGTYPLDWKIIRDRVDQQRHKGELVCGGLPHGHTFLRLQDIRGYENLIFDMLYDEPNLVLLIEMVEKFNYQYVMKWLELEPDMMSYPEDLGMQIGPMLSPDSFVSISNRYMSDS